MSALDKARDILSDTLLELQNEDVNIVDYYVGRMGLTDEEIVNCFAKDFNDFVYLHATRSPHFRLQDFAMDMYSKALVLGYVLRTNQEQESV